MENAYGIGVKNRYELFYDEDVDPLEIIRQKEEEKEKRKTDKHCKDKTKVSKSGKSVSSTGLPKKAKENTAVNTPKSSETTEPSNKTRAKPFTDRTSKTRNFEDAKDVEDRKNFRNRDEHPLLSSDVRERDGESRRSRGGFRGRGRTRGRGNFFGNFEGRPRREFDRHSGSDKSGFRPAEKRDGAGPGNWGDLKSEFNSRRREAESTWMDEEFDASGDKQNDSCWKEILPAETEMSAISHNELTAEKCGDTTVPESMDSKENEPVTEERPEEGLREMTLDEWKRQQEAKRAVPKYNLRKPGEGEDGNQWKKLYMLKKKAKEDDEEEDEDDDEDVDDEEFARRGRHRQLVDIQINFNDSRRGRGRGRGVRGVGPRSGGGSMGNKDSSREERREMGSGSSVGNRSFGRGKVKSGQQSAPRVDDWNDFPSLVTA